MQKQTNRRKVFDLGAMGFNRCLDFGYYRYHTVEPVLQTHQHTNVLEICFCLKGQQYYQIEGELFKLTGNTILIVPPDVDHSSGIYPEDIGELFWLQLSLKNEKKGLCDLPVEKSNFLLKELEKSNGKLFKGAFELKNILEKIIVLLEAPKNTLGQLQLGQLIISLLLETLMLSKLEQSISESERVGTVKQFIEKNIHRIIYVDELAALVGLSVPHLKFWFKRQFGVPPRAYCNRLKIERSKKDLLIKKSVTEVAFDLGFSSSQYFSTTFKKYTGSTPEAYRLGLKQ